MNVDFSCINLEITSIKQKTLGKRGYAHKNTRYD